jgi:dihydrofolate synthase/folylpolyglutamate synthase
MTYARALQYLSQLARFGMKPGTDRLAEVLRRLSDPQERFLCLHIAGTNGKGSTAAFSASLLLHAAAAARGKADSAPPRIGLYTSPHLCRVRERIQIDGSECQEAEFADVVARVKAAAAGPSTIDLTFFEVLTAAAFLLFAERAVRVAVIETGLGGRLDATRLCQAGSTVITSIDLDHTEVLGGTLPEIAREKAGIFRAGVPAFVACDDAAARAMLCAEARRLAAPLWLYDHRGEPEAHPLPALPEKLRAVVPLVGAHQQRNAALALAAVTMLPDPELAAAAQREAVQSAGLRATRWPGRLERLWPSSAVDAGALFSRLSALPPPGSEVWIDAAHNPEGSRALSRYLDAVSPAKPLTVLFGVVAGKAAMEMTEPLLRAKRIFLTRPPSPRGLAPEVLAVALGPLGLPAATVVTPDDIDQALRQALRATDDGGLLLIYGSIFLIGAVRSLWFDEPCDPLYLQDPIPAQKEPRSA